MDRLIGDAQIPVETLAVLRQRGGKWAAYQNVGMDSANLGHIQFLKFGLGCTYSAPPEQYLADTAAGAGWRYRHVGFVDVAGGLIVEAEPVDRASPGV